MNKKNKKDLALINFKKSKAHISKIIEMIEKEKYCIDIMQQNLAVIGLLKSAHWLIMENHFKHCFKNVLESKNSKKKEEMINEILKVVKLFNK
jgi:DNA-binding FrmR family transcriptional regulator